MKGVNRKRNFIRTKDHDWIWLHLITKDFGFWLFCILSTLVEFDFFFICHQFKSSYDHKPTGQTLAEGCHTIGRWVCFASVGEIQTFSTQGLEAARTTLCHRFSFQYLWDARMKIRTSKYEKNGSQPEKSEFNYPWITRLFALVNKKKDKIAKMRFCQSIAGLSFRDRVRSPDIHIERSWFSHLDRRLLPPGRFFSHVHAGGDTGAHLRHVGEITSLRWPGNALRSLWRSRRKW